MADTTIHPSHPTEAADLAPNGDQIPLQGDLHGAGMKRPKEEDEGDGDGDENSRKERRKIQIKFIEDKSRRHITFSKRKAGIMKKVRHNRVLRSQYHRILANSRHVSRHMSFPFSQARKFS